MLQYLRIGLVTLAGANPPAPQAAATVVTSDAPPAMEAPTTVTDDAAPATTAPTPTEAAPGQATPAATATRPRQAAPAKPTPVATPSPEERSAAAQGAGGELPRLFVINLRGEAGVDPAHVRLLNEILLDTIQETDRFTVIGEADIAAMMQAEQSRQMLGCDDVVCLAEIGGAVGADLSLSGTIGALGAQYVLGLKIVSSEKSRVIGRWSETIAGEPDVMIASIKRGVRKVAADALGLDPRVLMPPPVPIYERWWLWTAIGTVAAATAAAIVVGVATQPPAPNEIRVQAVLPERP